MRFVVTGEWTRNRLLVTIVWLFLGYTALLWVTNGVLYFSKMGLTYDSVVEYYRGHEPTFRQPRTLGGLAEVAHFHMFAMGVLLMTLTHLLLFVPLDVTLKAVLIAVSFLAGIAGEGAGWLVRFVHPGFAYLKIISFLTLQGALAVLMGCSAYALLTRAPSAYMASGAEPGVVPVVGRSPAPAPDAGRKKRKRR